MARGKSKEDTARGTRLQDAAAIKEFMSTRDLRPLMLPRDTRVGGYNNGRHDTRPLCTVLEHVYAAYVCRGNGGWQWSARREGKLRKI